jgi:hypothetical protein
MASSAFRSCRDLDAARDELDHGHQRSLQPKDFFALETTQSIELTALKELFENIFTQCKEGKFSKCFSKKTPLCIAFEIAVQT